MASSSTFGPPSSLDIVALILPGLDKPISYNDFQRLLRVVRSDFAIPTTTCSFQQWRQCMISQFHSTEAVPCTGKEFSTYHVQALEHVFRALPPLPDPIWLSLISHLRQPLTFNGWQLFLKAQALNPSLKSHVTCVFLYKYCMHSAFGALWSTRILPDHLERSYLHTMASNSTRDLSLPSLPAPASSFPLPRSVRRRPYKRCLNHLQKLEQCLDQLLHHPGLPTSSLPLLRRAQRHLLQGTTALRSSRSQTSISKG